MAGLKLGYARVSTDDQDLTAQRDALAALNTRARIDRVQAVGIAPNRPLPYLGGERDPRSIRPRVEGDDGDTDPAPDPELTDLPALRAHGGTRDPHRR